jgi:kumamolisin
MLRRRFPQSLCCMFMLGGLLLPGAGGLGTAQRYFGAARVESPRQGSPLLQTLKPHAIAYAYSPAQIATAYNFLPLYKEKIDGTGQTIALIELDQYSAVDLATFDQSYGLAAPSVQPFYTGGRPFTLDSEPETAFDLEWAHALAPGANIQIYYLNQAKPVWKQMAWALHMAAANGAGIVSISLGACIRGSKYRVTRRALSDLMKEGVSVFVSSGDYGDHAGPKHQCGTGLGVSYPASDPSVVAVGGTSLYLNQDDTIQSEIAWRLSGGGRAAGIIRSPWDHATTMPSGRERWAPDVAFLGDEKTGVSYFQNGQWAEAGGTSLGAPAWAAAWALIRQYMGASAATMNPAAKLIYRIGNSPEYGAAFHDITSGSNGFYRASVGWDAVTGWGTPNVAGMATTVKGFVGF